MGFEATTVETTEWVSVSLKTEAALEKVWVELVRADKAWSSGKVEIDSTGNVIEANLLEGKANSFTILVYDDKGNSLPCFPEEISIIQGAKVGSAPLPYNIGIATWDENKKRGVFRMAKGLEKNKPLPAVGVVNDLKTSCQLRPGVERDMITIPIYQTDDFAEAEGRTASLYEYVADVVITGDDVDALIQEDSSVDVTLKVDSSEQMRMEVHFLASDITVDKELDTSKKQSIEDAEREINKGLKEAQRSLANLEKDGIAVQKQRERLDLLRTEHTNNTEKKMVLQHLKEVLREIEDLENSTEWQRLEKELREEFDRLERAQKDLGNEDTQKLVEELRRQTDSVIRSKDVKIGREVLEQINMLYFQLTMVYQCMGLIRDCNERFGSIRWKDGSRARQLINRGLEEMNNRPSTERLQPIAAELIGLMPEDDAANAGGLLR